MGKVTVKFEGVAGSGKTKLAHHIASILQASGMHVSVEVEKYNGDGTYDEIIVDTSTLIRGPNFVGKASRPNMAPERYEDSQPQHHNPEKAGGIYGTRSALDEDDNDLQSLMDRDRE